MSPVRFEALVAASEAVKQTRSRQQKVELLAACIAEMAAERPPDVVAVPGLVSGEAPRPQHTSLRVGVAYLAGDLPQGRIGLGPSAVFKNLPSSAREAGSLLLTDVDAVFEAIAQVSGGGAVRERMRLWLGLLERCTAAEQTYLRRLVVGELRQGALESLVADAVAKAAKVSPGSVRRALMLAG